MLAKGENLFLTVEAGAGKFHFLEHTTKHFLGKNSLVCAPAWKAAARVGGTSMQWWAGVNVGTLEVRVAAALYFIRIESTRAVFSAPPRVRFACDRRSVPIASKRAGKLRGTRTDCEEERGSFGGIKVVRCLDLFASISFMFKLPTHALLFRG